MAEYGIIVNSKGVPGTITCLAYSLLDSQPLFLCNHHVLFGKGAREKEMVGMLLNGIEEPQKVTPIGTALSGSIGNVNYQGKPCFIDCAIIQLQKDGCTFFDAENFVMAYNGIASPSLGLKVSKWGGGSGFTEGIITDIQHHDKAIVYGKSEAAFNQLVVRPLVAYHSFAVPGDSGAAIIDEENRIIGMLWGVTNVGDGIASPILPVFHELNISFEARLQG